MKFTTFTTPLLISFLSLAVFAAPLEPRDVYVPPITKPIAGDIWIVGECYDVKWDTSNPPAQITNTLGEIDLRRNNITFLTLAKGFDIRLGTYKITVPQVPDGDDYQIVLFGDSGNFSPYFTIENI